MAFCPSYLSKLGAQGYRYPGEGGGRGKEGLTRHLRNKCSGKAQVMLEDMNGYEPSVLYLRWFL